MKYRTPNTVASKANVSAIAGLTALFLVGSPVASFQAVAGTNAITSFAAGKSYLYLQNTAGAPTADPYPSYAFIATTTLSSNRTADSITVTFPSGGTSNLLQSFVVPDEYLLFVYDTDMTRFESMFPEGDYVFRVTAAASNQQVTASLPAGMPQPNAPHISNYTEAQTLNPAAAFTLTWDPFETGTAADYILVTIGNKVFQTPGPGTPGALSGIATSVTIPAGKLTAGSNYMSQIIFYHVAGTTNATYSTGGYRATATQFNVNTTGSAPTGPLLSNLVWDGGLRFDVSALSGRVLKVLFSTDFAVPLSEWTTLLTTNPIGTSVQITIPPQAATAGFFRLEN